MDVLLSGMSEQGYFWSGEAACVLLIEGLICSFPEQKIQRRLIQNKLSELLNEYTLAKKMP